VAVRREDRRVAGRALKMPRGASPPGRGIVPPGGI
jgi:hypothetical protein